MLFDHITVGELGLTITFLVGFITGIKYLHKHLKEWITQSLKDQLDSIKGEIKGLHKRIDDVNMEACKNFLVARLAQIEKGNPLDEIEGERFWEEYQIYTEMGGNSYIKRKVEQLKKDGRL